MGSDQTKENTVIKNGYDLKISRTHFRYFLRSLRKKISVKSRRKTAPTETETRVSGLMNIKIMITKSEMIAK